jgi:hypothetical protein
MDEGKREQNGKVGEEQGRGKGGKERKELVAVRRR